MSGKVKRLSQMLVGLAIGFVVAGIATLVLHWPFANLGTGELRCESGGAIVITVAGKDYAVNGMASGRYPPVQQIWNQDTYPDTNIDRLIARGLTLCAW